MKNKILSVIAVFFALSSYAQPDSVYYFLNGIPNYVTQQPDVCSFRLNDRSEFTGTLDSTVVDHVRYFGSGDGIHNVYFSATATEAEKESILLTLQSSPSFEKFFAVATKTSNYNEPYSERKYMGTDMFINIMFNDPQMSLTDVDSFAASYEMNVIFAPAPSLSTKVYILEVKRNHQLFDYYSPYLTIEIARDMWINHESIIDKVAPSIGIAMPHDPSDELYSSQWWAEDGAPTACNGVSGSTDASIDLDCAWNYEYEFSDGPSYSGDGVVVGVIDFHGIEYTHPDCENLFTKGYYAFDDDGGGASVGEFDFDLYLAAWDEAHFQNVSGVIGANIDNEIGSAGVAYGSKITPALMLRGSTAELNALLMRLLELPTEEQIDIINMSFGFSGMDVPEAMGFPFYDVMEACADHGRGGKGIVLIASAGNDDAYREQIPAVLPFVLSVAATNPFDQLKESGDGYDPLEYTWGSTYFDYLDVAAPGICISSTDFTDDNPAFPDYDGNGYATGNYFSFSGTSAAAPIVSGIAALVLEKAPGLTREEVYDVIRLSCDKVGGYAYSNPGASGRTLKLGYGRVNACKALDVIDELGLEESERSFSFITANPVVNDVQVWTENISNYDVQLISLTGQIIFEGSFQQTNSFIIDMENLSKGFYYLTIVDTKTELSSSVKLIKQ